MNYNLAPTYQQLFGTYWVLWYSKSNNYSIVDSEFKSILDIYLQSSSDEDFKAQLALVDKESDAFVLAKNIYSYLQNCNVSVFQNSPITKTFNPSCRNILKQYEIDSKKIKIYYHSDLVKRLIHPQIAHLEVDNTSQDSTVFDIYLEENELFLFKNETLITSAPKSKYNLIQGKFTMHLLCTIHGKTEEDWIGTFHGSTISDGINSILCIGKSGKGKSTLCALLASNGFKLVADDVSPMLSENNHIYSNPTAISIKEGAFNLLKDLVSDFENLTTVTLNSTKGPIKYIPHNNSTTNNYPCKAVILVNYKKNADTVVEEISIKQALETLIPDSWLSPNSLHAKQFIDWLVSTKLYQITYSNTASVTTEISLLFRELGKN